MIIAFAQIDLISYLDVLLVLLTLFGAEGGVRYTFVLGVLLERQEIVFVFGFRVCYATLEIGVLSNIINHVQMRLILLLRKLLKLWLILKFVILIAKRNELF